MGIFNLKRKANNLRKKAKKGLQRGVRKAAQGAQKTAKAAGKAVKNGRVANAAKTAGGVVARKVPAIRRAKNAGEFAKDLANGKPLKRAVIDAGKRTGIAQTFRDVRKGVNAAKAASKGDKNGALANLRKISAWKKREETKDKYFKRKALIEEGAKKPRTFLNRKTGKRNRDTIIDYAKNS